MSYNYNDVSSTHIQEVPLRDFRCVSFFIPIMVSEDHTCEARETLDDFSLDPNALDTPPFKSYGRGLFNVPPDEVSRSSYF